MKIALSTLAAAVATIAIAAPASAQVYTTALGTITVPPSVSFSPTVVVTTSGITTLYYTFTLNSAMTLTSSGFTNAGTNPFSFTGVSLQNSTGSTTYLTGTSTAGSATLGAFSLAAGNYRINLGGTSTATPGNSASIGSSIAFAAAPVPEAATWAMMIAGFGLVGGAMRRRSTKVAFA